MPVGWAAAGAAVAGLAGAAMSADASRDAARTQREGAAYAADVQREMFDVSRAQQQPFMESGYGANALLSRLMGITPQTATGARSGSGIPEDIVGSQGGIPMMNRDLYASDPAYRHAWDAVLASERQSPQWKNPNASTYYTAGNDADFARISDAITREMLSYREANPTASGTPEQMEASDQSGLQTGYLTQLFGPEQFAAGLDPGYQWRQQQGAQNVMNTAAAGSGSLSGPALRALMQAGQGQASQEYDAAFNRFQTQQGNIFQRLTSMAGLGQNAAAGVGNQAVATGGNIGANITGGANAAAAGQIGAANAWGGALSDLGSVGAWYAMNRNPPPKG